MPQPANPPARPARPRATRARLARLLDRYDVLPLECDGFTRVAAYCLAANGIAYRVWAGRCETAASTVEPHFWLTVGRYVVDYRLRLWAGGDAPHGVFVPPADCRYYAHEATLYVSPLVYDVLAGGIPAVPTSL